MRWRYRTTVLSLCVLGFFVTYFARMAISPVVPLIAADFAVSNTAIGVALSGMWLAYGLSQFPSGVLGDRFGEKSVILWAIGGSAVASLVLAASPAFALFVVSAVGLGAVAGLHYPVGTTLLSRTYDDLGRAIGIHTMGGPLAGLVAPVAAAWVAVRYGWRPAVGLTVLVAVPVFALFALRVRPTPPQRPEEPMRNRFDPSPLVALLSRPAIAFSLSIAMLGTFVVQGMLSFLPTFLIEHHGYSTPVAGAAFSAFFVVRATGQFLLGELSDYRGRDIAIGVSLFAGCAGTVVLVLAPADVAITAGVALVGLGASFFAALDPRFLDHLSPEERGTGFGLVRTAYTVVGSAGSLGVGLLADLFGWRVAFLVLGGLFAITIGTLVLNWALSLGY